MLKYVRVGVPVLVVLVTVFNAIAAYGADNTTALYANITALFGWLVVAGDEVVYFRRQRASKDGV
jgi:hypothetical protein